MGHKQSCEPCVKVWRFYNLLNQNIIINFKNINGVSSEVIIPSRKSFDVTGGPPTYIYPQTASTGFQVPNTDQLQRSGTWKILEGGIFFVSDKVIENVNEVVG
jgi:hypothetical protein